MKYTGCENLDRYLANGLSESENAEFQAHLTHCSSCREELRRQQRVDRLLVEATLYAHRPSKALVQRIERRLRRATLRRRLAWGSGVAASLAACFAVWFVTVSMKRNPGEARPHLVHRTDQQAQPPEIEEPAVQVTFHPSSDVIVVPKTANRRVTILWTYPTVQASRQFETPSSSTTALP